MEKQQKLIYLKGLPASGKSTWAKEYVEDNPNTVIVNRDSIREMLIGAYKSFPFGSSLEKLVTDIENDCINDALLFGCTVIIDATNFKFTEAKRIEYEKALQIPVEINDSFLEVPLEECIRRDEERKKDNEKSVGKDVITYFFNTYIKKTG